MLSFNSNGLLIPNRNIQSNITELEEVFVTSVRSITRRELFDKYISYSTSLKKLCGNVIITQWIDGSFVTKKDDPGDIDLVTFIDFSIVETLNDNLTDYKYPASENLYGCLHSKTLSARSQVISAVSIRFGILDGPF